MVNFQFTISLISDKFLDFPADIIQLLSFFRFVSVFSYIISNFYVHAIFDLKISLINTLLTLEKYKLLILNLICIET